MKFRYIIFVLVFSFMELFVQYGLGTNKILHKIDNNTGINREVFQEKKQEEVKIENELLKKVSIKRG